MKFTLIRDGENWRNEAETVRLCHEELVKHLGVDDGASRIVLVAEHMPTYGSFCDWMRVDFVGRDENCIDRDGVPTVMSLDKIKIGGEECIVMGRAVYTILKGLGMDYKTGQFVYVRAFEIPRAAAEVEAEAKTADVGAAALAREERVGHLFRTVAGQLVMLVAVGDEETVWRGDRGFFITDVGGVGREVVVGEYVGAEMPVELVEGEIYGLGSGGNRRVKIVHVDAEAALGLMMRPRYGTGEWDIDGSGVRKFDLNGVGLSGSVEGHRLRNLAD